MEGSVIQKKLVLFPKTTDMSVNKARRLVLSKQPLCAEISLIKMCLSAQNRNIVV